MCNRGYNLVFKNGGCEIRKGSSDTLVATKIRTNDNFYQLKGSDAKCFMSQINEIWLWHRRMGHINFDILVNINNTNVVKDFPNITKPINVVCK